MLLGIVAGVVILLGFAAWRLSEGPIPLNFLTPKLVKAFAAGGTQVSIAQTLLVWDDQRQSLDLRVRGLTLLDDDGDPGLTLPESNLTLSIAALFRGDIVVSALKVLGAELRLTRLADGSLLGLGGNQAAAPADGGTPPPEPSPALGLIDSLLADDASSPLAGLEGIGLVDSTIVFDDRPTGQVWTLPAKQIDLRREARGLSGEAELAVMLDDETAYIQVVFAYGKRRGLLDLSADVQRLSIAKLAKALPDLAPLALLDSRVSGQINITLAQDAGFGLVDFDFTLGPGSLWFGDAGQPAIPLNGGNVAGFYDSAADKLELDRLLLQTGTAALPGPTVKLTGSVAHDAHGRVGDFTVTLDRVSASTLTHYWPAAVAPGGRQWVADNILGGSVQDLQARALLRLGSGVERPSVVVESLAGGFDFVDLTVAYLAPLPPATGVNGKATLGLASLNFNAVTATVDALTFAPLDVEIFGLDGEDHRLRLATLGSGPLPALFAVLDHPRLGLLTKLGLPSAGAQGKASVSLNFDFSLRGELEFEDVDTATTGTFEDLVLPDIWQGQDLTAQRLELAFDGKLLSVHGTVGLDGNSFETEWTEPVDGGERHIKAKSDKVAASTLQKLLPALQGKLEGSLALALDLRGNPQGRSTLGIEANLAAAALTLPDLGITKPPGQPASARFTARLEKGRVTALEKLAVEAPGLAATGSVTLGDDGQVLGASLTQLTAFGQTLAGVQATPLAGGGWQLQLTGGTLDARPWLENMGQDGKDDSGPATPLLVEASRLDRVILPKGSLDGVKLSLARDAEGIQQIALSGALRADGGSGGPLSLMLRPDASGRRQLSLQAGDMGALFRALDITKDVVGGTLVIEARAETADRNSRLVGTVEGQNFGLLDAPTFSRMLGMADDNDTQGFPFERLTGEIAWDNGVLSTPLLRAYGGSLGITTKGSLDFNRDVIDLEGTVVPAYSIYKVIGNIPIVGWIITGGENGGFLAVSYSVNGSISAPQLNANPLSALTPGFLRGLFGLLEDDGSLPPPSLYPDPPNR